MCVAQGISFAIHKPLIPISSLAALAQTAYLEQQGTKQLVAVDAQAGQIYWGVYEVNDEGQMVLQGEEQTCAPQEIDLSALHSNTEWYGIGDAWAKYQPNLLAHIGFCPQIIKGPQRPTAEAILKLAEFNLIQSQ
jgi:tRNA threonylcarbamoyladenosine biosynthesis protein TsaB